MRTWLRIFVVGGAISFRALFSWIRPSVYVPTLLLGPTTQVLFFAYLGRTAHLESDDWFVVGNAVRLKIVRELRATYNGLAGPARSHEPSRRSR